MKINEKQFRTATFSATRADGDENSRRVEIAISSETPVERPYGTEILMHGDGNVRLDFLNGGSAPFLMDHNHMDQVGVVEKAWVDSDRKLRGIVRFSKSARGADMLQDVLDGIRCNISVGYQIEQYEHDEKTDTVKATRWFPFEASLVAVPADAAVGVGRTYPQSRKESNMADGNPFTRDEESKEMVALARAHGGGKLLDAAQDHIATGKTLSQFRGYVLTNLPQGNTVGERMERGYRPGFDVGALLRAKVSGDPRGAELELDQSAELTAKNGGSRGFLVPTEALARAPMLTTGGAAALQAVDHRGDLYENSLLPGSVALRAGARLIQGLQSNVSIPRETAGPTAAWVAENGAITESNPTYDNLTLQPKILVARVSLSRKALLQGIPDMDELLKRSMRRQFASALDKAVLNGAGAPAPTGILNAVGINSQAVGAGGQITWAEVCLAWQRVAEDAVSPDDSMSWIAPPVACKIMRSTARFSGGDTAILDDVTSTLPNADGSMAVLAGSIMGRPCFETSAMPTTKVLLGKFSDVLIGQFGAIEFVLDEVTLAASSGIQIFAYAYFDVTILHAESFCQLTGI